MVMNRLVNVVGELVEDVEKSQTRLAQERDTVENCALCGRSYTQYETIALSGSSSTKIGARCHRNGRSFVV